MAGNDEHWQRLTRVESDLDIIKPEVSALKTDVSYIRSSMEQLLARNNRPTQFAPIIAAAGVIMTIMGGYTVLVTSPIDRARQDNTAKIDSLQKSAVESAYRDGQQDMKIEWTQDWLRTVGGIQREDRLIREQLANDKLAQAEQ